MKLYRSQTDKKIGGVCGGLGHYLGIDSTLIRLFFVLLAFGEGIGVLLYIILWILMPEEPYTSWESAEARHGLAHKEEIADRARSIGEDLQEVLHTPDRQVGLIIGAGLIILGSIFLLQNLNIPWLWWFDFDILWPLLIIAAGIALLFRHTRGE